MNKLKAILVAAGLAVGLVASPAAAAPVYKHAEPTLVVKTVKVDPYGGVLIEKDLVTDVKFKRSFNRRGFRSRGFNRRGVVYGRTLKKKSVHHGRFGHHGVKKSFGHSRGFVKKKKAIGY